MNIASVTKFDGLPCRLDHNGECLICDCFMEYCGYNRLKTKNYRWENEEQLKEMFKDFIEGE